MTKYGPDYRLLLRMEALGGCMTPKEPAKPDILNAKGKISSAKGSGTTVQDVNRLLKMHQEMSTAMKKLRKMGGMKALMGLMGKMPGGAGGLAGMMGGGGGGGLPGLPGAGGPGGLPPGFDKFLERRSEEHTSELQSLMRISYAVFCLKK